LFQKLHEINLTKEQKINELYFKLVPRDSNLQPTYSDESSPIIISLQIEIQNKDKEIHDLKHKLNSASSSPSNVVREPKYRRKTEIEFIYEFQNFFSSKSES
jgi:hypothetical protein